MSKLSRRYLWIFLALAGALAAGGGLLGARALRDASARPASLGTAVQVPGGQLRVDAVIAEHMAPMHSSKFAQSGMTMSSMGVDLAPAGYRRFTIEISLAGQAGGLRYGADRFTVEGVGMPSASPLRTHLGDGFVPAGAAAEASLTFQVPEAATNLVLRFAGAARPVALDLPTAPGDSHNH